MILDSQLCEGEGLYKWKDNGKTCGSEAPPLDIDLRVSAFSAAVRTDGGGLGGRSTTEFLIVQSRYAVAALELGDQHIHPTPTHCSPLYVTCADCCCVHRLHRHGDTTSIDTIFIGTTGEE